jgi:steroid 5-alpha reductase family enzyme
MVSMTSDQPDAPDAEPSKQSDAKQASADERVGWPKGIVVGALITSLGLALAWAGGQGGAVVAGLPLMVWAALAAFAIQWIVFVPSYLAQTEHYFDLTGSLTYQTVAWGTLVASSTFAPRQLLIAAMVALWSARLGIFLFRRVKQDGKDGRFDAIKPDGGRFFIVWNVQGLWVTLTMAAGLGVLSLDASAPVGVLDGVGIAVWIIGFALEVLADRQKRVFKADPANKGRFITSGLWSWSRHPNYFGEIVLWAGVALIALSDMEGWRYVTLISPFFVAFLLTKVSGLPMLEDRADKKWGGEADYEAYKARTSILVPLPPRG